MKKLLLFTLLFSLSYVIQAQNTKPTKEQTIEFIINTLKDLSFNNTNDMGGGWGTMTVKREIQEISIVDCRLNIKMHFYSETSGNEYSPAHFRDFTSSYEINLEDIEKVTFSYGGKIGANDIKFECKNKSSLIKADQVVTKTNKNYNDRNFSGTMEAVNIHAPEEYEKLIQAFNHLRKLCGAPEPIEF